jgi:formamidopyrimidine-DNA glycosylase
MPELPDVEVFKRYMDATSLHQKIRSVGLRRRLAPGEFLASGHRLGLRPVDDSGVL